MSARVLSLIFATTICYIDLNDGQLHYASVPGNNSAVICTIGLGPHMTFADIGDRICVERTDQPGRGVGLCYDANDYWRPVNDGRCGASPYSKGEPVS